MCNARKRSEDKPAINVNWRRELRRIGYICLFLHRQQQPATAVPSPRDDAAIGMAALSPRESRSVCVSWRGRRRRYPSFSIASTACFRTSVVRARSQLINSVRESVPPDTRDRRAVSSVAFLYRRTISVSLALAPTGGRSSSDGGGIQWVCAVRTYPCVYQCAWQCVVYTDVVGVGVIVIDDEEDRWNLPCVLGRPSLRLHNVSFFLSV